MPLKQVFLSDPGVYRDNIPLGLIDPWASSADRDRLYDEYIIAGHGLGVVENPDTPTDYEIVFFAENAERTDQGANFVAMRWSGLTGKYLGPDDRAGLGYRQVTVGAKGTIRSTHFWVTPDNAVHKFDPFSFTWTLVHPSGYYAGYPFLTHVPCVDEDLDLALIIGQNDNHVYGEIAVHRESTGAFLYKFRVNGNPECIFLADERRGYCVSTDGIISLFDYTTGQVLSVMHAGLSNYYRAWAWDRIAKRILCFELTPDTMPAGTCTCRVKGYYPVPMPHGMTAPIPLDAPAVGRRVEVLTKAYGGAGEGCPGMIVNFALATPSGMTLNPVAHTTDQNGNARTFITGVLAGDNAITATMELP